MTKGRFLFLLFFAGLLSLAACGGESTPGDTSTDDGIAKDACVGCGESYEASFVVSKLMIGTINQGFNLDGENTQCTDNSCISDGDNGVDNRLSAILDAVNNATSEDFDANASIQENIDKGDMLVVLRLLDVNVTQMASVTSSDGQVELKGYMGLDTDDPENPDDNFSKVEPMNVDSRSLNPPGTDIESTLIDFQSCNISAGKLRCEPSLFTLDLEVSGNPLSLRIEQTQIVAVINQSPTLDPTSGAYLNGSIIQGIIGGYVPVSYLQEALKEFADQLGDISPATIQQILVEHADIDATPAGSTGVACPNGNSDCLPWQTCRSGICEEPADQPDAISLAVTFEAVSVEFTGNIIVPPEE
jgi:hypothetical protein